jgi:hypothetical protein
MTLSSAIIPDFLKNMFSDSVEQKCMYVFRTNQLLERLKVNCSGNVHSAPLRETIALRMGFEIIKRAEGEDHNIVSRIHNDKDHTQEQFVSAYIKSGNWAWQTITSDEDSRYFYRYLCAELHPKLQSSHGHGKYPRANLYSQWLDDINSFKKITCSDLDRMDFSASAVGVFYHSMLPEDFKKSRTA